MNYNGRGLHGQVVEAVGRRIVQGAWPEGHTFDLDALQREHGVSLTVIREALKVLAGKGLVGARQRRGTFVEARTEWNLLDPDILLWEVTPTTLGPMLEQLSEVRGIFEPAAAALAASRRTPEHLETIRRALELMGSATSAAEAADADIAFHRAVLDATGNDLLGRVEMLTRSLFSERDRLVHAHVVGDEFLALHRGLVDAIDAADPDAARVATERLLGLAAADVTQSILEGRDDESADRRTR